MKIFNEKGTLDYTGAVVSWICAVHCLAMPFLLTILPLSSLSFLADEATEWLIIGLAVIIALISLLPAYFRQHRKMRSVLLFALGMGLILFSHLAFEADFGWNILPIVGGAILITAAHFINRRLCLECKNCRAIKPVDLSQKAIQTTFSSIH